MFKLYFLQGEAPDMGIHRKRWYVCSEKFETYEAAEVHGKDMVENHFNTYAYKIKEV